MVIVSSTKSQMISGLFTQYVQNIKGTDLKWLSETISCREISNFIEQKSFTSDRLNI